MPDYVQEIMVNKLNYLILPKSEKSTATSKTEYNIENYFKVLRLFHGCWWIVVL